MPENVQKDHNKKNYLSKLIIIGKNRQSLVSTIFYYNLHYSFVIICASDLQMLLACLKSKLSSFPEANVQKINKYDSNCGCNYHLDAF